MNHPLINSTNTNKIWKESRGRAWSMSDFQYPELQTFFNDCIHCEFHCYNTADADDQSTQRTRSSSVIVLSHLTWNMLISTQEILIFWENGLLNRSVYHLLEMIHYIPSQWPAFQTNSNIPKELKQVTTIEVWFNPRGSDIRNFYPWFWLATKFHYGNQNFLNTFRAILSHHI